MATTTEIVRVGDAQPVVRDHETVAIQRSPHVGEQSVEALVERKKKIRRVIGEVMVDGEHYGKIPGCGDKPTLLKPGAEILCMTFGLAPKFAVVKTELGNGHREVDVTCTLEHIATGALIGQGIGSCSTMESKYRWRRGERKCPECGKACIIKGKEEYGGGWLCYQRKGGCGAKWPDGAKEIEGQDTGRVENPDIADVLNTVLKMAKKRALVDATLSAAGASDFLAQDLEDIPADEPRYRGYDERTSGNAAVDIAMQSSDAQRNTPREARVGQTHRDWDPPDERRPRNEAEAIEAEYRERTTGNGRGAERVPANVQTSAGDSPEDEARKLIQQVASYPREKLGQLAERAQLLPPDLRGEVIKVLNMRLKKAS